VWLRGALHPRRTSRAASADPGPGEGLEPILPADQEGVIMENTLYFGEEGRHAEKDSQYFQNYTDCIIIVSLPNQLREIRK
jgi:hypothetical protein